MIFIKLEQQDAAVSVLIKEISHWIYKNEDGNEITEVYLYDKGCVICQGNHDEKISEAVTRYYGDPLSKEDIVNGFEKLILNKEIDVIYSPSPDNEFIIKSYDDRKTEGSTLWEAYSKL